MHMEASHLGRMFVSIPIDIPDGTIVEALQIINSAPTDIDNDVVLQVRGNITTNDWKDFPSPATNRKFGDDWVEDASSAILRVPSAIVPTESNFLLNIEHPDFRNFEIGEPKEYVFDGRL